MTAAQMTAAGPAGLVAVTQQIDAINQLIEGGFSSVLAGMAAAPPDIPSVPLPASSQLGPSTALLTGAPAPAQPSSRRDAPSPTEMNSPMALANGPMALAPAPASMPEPAQPPASATGAGSVAGDEVVATAARYIGTPYLWGGESPAGFDCSGLVQYVYRQLGIELPRTSQEQATAGVAVPGLAEARPGDLVFFAGSDGTAQHPGHVGIYIGNGLMIDAPYSGATVQVQPVANPVEIRDVLAGAPPGAQPALANAPGTTAFGASGLGASAAPAGSGQYAQLFAQATADYSLPPGLLQAVATVESHMGPQAVSPAGAEGMMQLMPQVAAKMNVDPFDPAQAVPAAASLLSSYLQRFGSLPLALAAYNAGPQAVADYNGMPPYPETAAYVADVTSLMGQPKGAPMSPARLGNPQVRALSAPISGSAAP